MNHDQSIFRGSGERDYALFTLMADGYALHELIFDEQGAPCDYRFLDLNPGFERITGLKREAVIGKAKSQVLPGDDRRWLKLYARVALTGEPLRFHSYAGELDRHYDIYVSCPEWGQFALVFMERGGPRQSRDRLTYLASFPEKNPNPIMELELDGNIRYANPAAFQLFPDLLEKGMDHPWLADWPAVSRTFQTGGTEMVSRILALDDRSYQQLFLFLAEERAVRLYSHEVTEQSRLTAALQESEARLRAIVDNMPIGVWFTDEAGTIVYGNEAGRRIWSGARYVGPERFHEYRARWLDTGEPLRPEDWAITRAIREGETSLDQELVIECFDGAQKIILNSAVPYHSPDGQIRGVVMLNEDITGRKRMEEALHQSERRFRAMFESHQAVMLLIEPHGGTIIDANAAAAEFYGYPRARLCGMRIQEINQLPEDDVAKLRGKTLEERRGYYIFPHRLAGGELRWVEVHSTPVEIGGRPLLFSIIHDITERQRFEAALQENRAELAAANEELQAQQEELTAAYEELQAQQEELTAANEELQAQQEELTTAYQELQRQDATVREHAAAALRARDEAQQRAAELSATLAAIAAGIIIYDPAGQIVHINEFAMNLLNYPREQYHTAYAERIMKLNLCKADGTPYSLNETPLYRALRGEVTRDEEMVIMREPGDPVWLGGTVAPIYDSQGATLGVIFVFQDITARKRQLEDRLASERELLRVTLDAIGEGVVASDPGGRVFLMNEAAAGLTGYSQAEASGEPFHKIMYIIDDKTSEPLVEIAAMRTINHPILVTRDLREVPIAINHSPIKAKDGRVIGTVTVFQDISAKQKTERELLKAEKLESLGILAGGIAHDFNNILAAILSNIQLAMFKLEKNEDVRTYLLNTVETARRASELTKQLLTFSKGGVPVKKDASLIELLRENTEFVLRGSKTKAEFAIPDDLWAATIDVGQISQVINNLVINAKQAMPRGGVLRVSAENCVVAPGTLMEPGQYVKITVQDQGVGISRENLSKIFDPFFTTKKEGNGLGLATSYSIIHQHNGYIEVDSQEGMGTTFTIYLPASDAALIQAEVQREIAAAGGLKILLMDDEQEILKAVGEMLGCFGHRVVLSNDGAAAVEMYRRAKEEEDPFDAVIMDLTIPGGMGGQEALACLREYDPQVKAIVSSGYANDPIMADYERYGFSGVVSKPYKIDELQEVLHRVFHSGERDDGGVEP
ncbi:PAS domain S-box-containing protein [Hydrogenispora ethanolica]|uniref:histidine kinase n=1 Tax=Hydrogenispora ethanolica TaxID=1082276 RepID=A0A4R1SAA9_HYDET|nr:PAS domain S-box protein [Hydrogenispora ethanolica]TCL76391.1 PAS domain S-box-containing protein [Hydrogenispora ethanolica]